MDFTKYTRIYFLWETIGHNMYKKEGHRESNKNMSLQKWLWTICLGEE